MLLAFHFVDRDTGFWALEPEKEVHGGSVDAFLTFTARLPVHSLRLYCLPANAMAFLNLCSIFDGNIDAEVLAPVCVPPEPVMRLKSLLAQHFSMKIHNHVCKPLVSNDTAWYLGIPDIGKEEVLEVLPHHTAYPMASFPFEYNQVATGRLLGYILSPHRFFDVGDVHNRWSRLVQSLDLTPKTAARFLAGDKISDPTCWAYASWNAGARLTPSALQQPSAFLHRIANGSEVGVARATRLWIRMLATYWRNSEMDEMMRADPGDFLRKPGEYDAAVAHLKAVIA